MTMPLNHTAMVVTTTALTTVTEVVKTPVKVLVWVIAMELVRAIALNSAMVAQGINKH